MTWEQRWHPLRHEWVIIAAHRQNRPWSGSTVGEQRPGDRPAYAADCFLCPGNERVGAARNDVYEKLFVFDNDHPSVGLDAPRDLPQPPGIYRVRPATGISRVLAYSPRHDLSLAELALPEVEGLLAEWQRQYRDLAARPEIAHVLVFENKGEVVGVSNPHPHCQIYATNFVFRTIEVEVEQCRRHLAETGRVLFQDILHAEKLEARRILFENETAVAFVPYFARYAYETYVASKRTVPNLAELDAHELSDFSRALHDTVVRFDNLWGQSFSLRARPSSSTHRWR